jgi:two-component system, LytTR family, sensor kinase
MDNDKAPPLAPRTTRPSFARMWAWSCAVWLAVWGLFALQSYIWYQSKGESLAPARVVASLGDWMVWAFLTPFLLSFIWQRPVTRATWRQSLPWQVFLAFAVSASYLMPFQLLRHLLSQVLSFPDAYKPFTASTFVATWVGALINYGDIVLVGHAIYYARDSRDQALRRAQLETRLAYAQLQVLRLQLHPHFLFNTLHTISALMHKDLRAADRMLALLGDLLRDSFERVGAQEVSLKQELGFLDRYLEIERTRFRDRLTVTFEVDPEALDAEVPNLLLQPLVENAIRHGLGKRQEAGRIEIVARRHYERLDIRIRDDGPGLPEGNQTALRTGVGLANTEARLEQLYGSNHRFDLRNRPQGGLEVVLEIPFRLRPETPTPSSASALRDEKAAADVLAAPHPAVSTR